MGFRVRRLTPSSQKARLYSAMHCRTESKEPERTFHRDTGKINVTPAVRPHYCLHPTAVLENIHSAHFLSLNMQTPPRALSGVVLHSNSQRSIPPKLVLTGFIWSGCPLAYVTSTSAIMGFPFHVSGQQRNPASKMVAMVSRSPKMTLVFCQVADVSGGNLGPKFSKYLKSNSLQTCPPFGCFVA